MWKSSFITVLKGMCVGATMLVPGVSGGSMAMILGIYDRLISAISSFFKHKRSSIILLGLFGLGSLSGIVLFAKPMLYVIEHYPMPAMYFFMGAILGGVPLMYKKASLREWHIKVIIYPVLGVLCVVGLAMLPTDLFSAEIGNGVMGYVLLTIAGFIAAIALVLPGISVSYMLLVMGLYDESMRAIGDLYWPFLIPMTFGVALGVILTTHLLEAAMQKHPQATYLLILGFVLASLRQVFPGFPTGITLLFCLAMLALGYGAIRALSKNE